MKHSLLRTGIVRFFTGAIASVFVLVACLPAHGSGTGIVDISLPWAYVVEEAGSDGEEVLQEADQSLTAMLRTVERVDLPDAGAAYLRLQYRRGVYGDRDAADQAFAGVSAAALGQEDRGRWDIILQAQNELHWLNSACGIPQATFQQVYADLVESVEKQGRTANRALLCRCGAECADVAIDR